MHASASVGSLARIGDGDLLLDFERELEDVALYRARGRLAEVEERAGEPLLVFWGRNLGFERDDRGKGQALQDGASEPAVDAYSVDVCGDEGRTEVMPCGIPYRAPSLCPSACERPRALYTRQGISTQPGHERLVRRGTDLYFSSLSGQRLIQDAIWSFWRASMSVGSALDFGRYVNRSASAA